MDRRIQNLLLIALWTLCVSSRSSLAEGTAFTYQGRLTDGTNAANGIYELKFTLFSTNTGAAAVAKPLTNNAVAVGNGLFTVALDFGSAVFAGPARWLEIGVRTNGSSGDFTTLTPRQPVTPTPYAIFAGKAGMLAENASQTFTGTIGFNPSTPGAPPFSVASAGKVNNLNVDLFDGLDSTNFLLKSEHCLTNIAELKARPAGFVPCVTVLGYYAPGDGGGGNFFWDASATENTNSGTIFVPDSNPPRGRWKRLYSGAVSVKWFGAVGRSAANDTVAIRAAIAALPIFPSSNRKVGTLYFPSGQYYIGDTLTITNDRTHVVGDGLYATTLIFDPDADKPLFVFAKPAGAVDTVLYQCSLKDMSFLGADGNTKQKIAIRAIDTSELTIENISTLSWTGRTSIALQLRGREATTVRKVSFYADRPISIEDNPNHWIDADHLHFEDIYLAALMTNEACILIEDGINVTNFAIDGSNPFGLGKHGIYWNDTTNHGSTSMNFSFKNIRREQSQDTNGYTVYLNHYVQNVLLDGVAADPLARGFYFRRVSKLTLQNCTYGGTNNEALNLDGSCYDVSLQNTFFQTGSTISVPGLEEVLSLQRYNTSVPTFIHYDTAINQDKFIKIYGVRVFKHTGTLATNETYLIPPSGYQKAGMLHLAAFGPDGPVNEGGSWLCPQSATLISGTPNTASGSVPGKLCILWESANLIKVVNNLAERVTYLLSIDWVPN